MQGRLCPLAPVLAWKAAAHTHTSAHAQVVAPALESNSAENASEECEEGAGKAAGCNQLASGGGGGGVASRRRVCCQEVPQGSGQGGWRGPVVRPHLLQSAVSLCPTPTPCPRGKRSCRKLLW